MVCKEIQNRLDKMYSEELNSDRLQEIFNENAIIQKISAPHLLSIDDSYCKAKIKIMFVGKETNKWWGKLDDFINTPNAIDILKQRYYAEFFGGKVPKAKNLSELVTYKSENHWNNSFFVEYKKVRKELLNNVKGSLIWSNLLKMDLDNKKGYSKNSISNQTIVDISKRIFQKELEILKPDFIIFATSYTYDNIIKYFLSEKIISSDVIEPKSLWKFKISDSTTCYRTWHPATIRYKAEKNKLEYYKMIINDIKKSY